MSSVRTPKNDKKAIDLCQDFLETLKLDINNYQNTTIGSTKDARLTGIKWKISRFTDACEKLMWMPDEMHNLLVKIAAHNENLNRNSLSVDTIDLLKEISTDIENYLNLSSPAKTDLEPDQILISSMIAESKSDNTGFAASPISAPASEYKNEIQYFELYFMPLLAKIIYACETSVTGYSTRQEQAVIDALLSEINKTIEATNNNQSLNTKALVSLNDLFKIHFDIANNTSKKLAPLQRIFNDNLANAIDDLLALELFRQDLKPLTQQVETLAGLFCNYISKYYAKLDKHQTLPSRADVDLRKIKLILEAKTKLFSFREWELLSNTIESLMDILLNSQKKNDPNISLPPAHLEQVNRIIERTQALSRFHTHNFFADFNQQRFLDLQNNISEEKIPSISISPDLVSSLARINISSPDDANENNTEVSESITLLEKLLAAYLSKYYASLDDDNEDVALLNKTDNGLKEAILELEKRTIPLNPKEQAALKIATAQLRELKGSLPNIHTEQLNKFLDLIKRWSLPNRNQLFGNSVQAKPAEALIEKQKVLSESNSYLLPR
jgi:hypothetical protein